MKVPKARRLPSGNWFIQLRLDGQSFSITKPTSDECIRAAELLKAEHRNDIRPRQAAGMTLRKAIDKYIEKRGTALSPSTIRGYKGIQRTRFQGVMDMPLNSHIQWQRVINTEAKQVSAKTIENAWFFIASVLRDNGLNVPNVKLPMVVSVEKQWLDPSQIPAFIAAANGDRCELAMLLCLHGCRKSEVIALKKKDFSFFDDGGTIHIHASTVLNEKGKYTEKTTGKTKAAKRDVPIMIPRVRELVEALPDDDSLVADFWPNMLYKHINSICKRNELPLVGVHGLRHSFASLAYHLGWSEEMTMMVGGWDDVKTMRKIYTHIAQSDKLKASNSMADFYKNI